MNLLDQAKTVPAGRPSMLSKFPEVDLQVLAIAVLSGQITQKQFTQTLGVHSGSFAGTVYPILKRALASGRLQLGYIPQDPKSLEVSQ